MRLLLPLLLLAAQLPAHAVPGEAGLAVPAPAERARLLASLFGPPELIVEHMIADAKRTFDDMVATDPQSRATEAAYPGAHAYVWAAVEPQMRAEALRAEEATLGEIAALFQSRLTAEEIEALIVYASTPQARRLTRATIAGIRTAPPGAPPAPTPGLAERVHSDFMAGLTPEEVRDLAEIIRGLPRGKFAALAPEVKRMRLEAVIRGEPQLQARIHAAMQAAMRRYMARRPPR